MENGGSKLKTVSVNNNNYSLFLYFVVLWAREKKKWAGQTLNQQFRNSLGRSLFA